MFPYIIDVEIFCQEELIFIYIYAEINSELRIYAKKVEYKNHMEMSEYVIDKADFDTYYSELYDTFTIKYIPTETIVENVIYKKIIVHSLSNNYGYYLRCLLEMHFYISLLINSDKTTKEFVFDDLLVSVKNNCDNRIKGFLERYNTVNSNIDLCKTIKSLYQEYQNLGDHQNRISLRNKIKQHIYEIPIR